MRVRPRNIMKRRMTVLSFCRDHKTLAERISDFYNYFQYGIDFLVSGVTHKVKKIILHTNIVRL